MAIQLGKELSERQNRTDNAILQIQEQDPKREMLNELQRALVRTQRDVSDFDDRLKILTGAVLKVSLESIVL